MEDEHSTESKSFIQVVASTANQALILQMSVPIKYYKYLLSADNTRYMTT